MYIHTYIYYITLHVPKTESKCSSCSYTTLSHQRGEHVGQLLLAPPYLGQTTRRLVAWVLSRLPWRLARWYE